MKTHKRVYVLFWIAFGIYAVSLLLPYRTETCKYTDGKITKHTDFGYEMIYSLSLISITPIVILTILLCVRHTRFTKWIGILIASLAVFFGVPSLIIASVMSFRCESAPELGILFHTIAYILFLIAMAVKFNIPVERKNNSNF